MSQMRFSSVKFIVYMEDGGCVGIVYGKPSFETLFINPQQSAELLQISLIRTLCFIWGLFVIVGIADCRVTEDYLLF